MTSDAAAVPASEASTATGAAQATGGTPVTDAAQTTGGTPASDASPVVQVLEAAETALEEKPLMRGWLHLGMFPAVVVAGVVLMAFTDSTRARVACGVYVLTACLLFGVSAVYHRGTWGPRGEAILRRLDHANIFLIIAGTYTPLTVLLLPPSTGRTLLWAVWLAAAAGIAFRVFWVGAPRWLYTPCYIAMGWAAVFFLPDFMRSGGIAVLVLVIVGGLLYSVGGVIYGMKRPDPSPRFFGFHEVFHALTVAAFVAHYVGISLAAYAH